MRTPARHAGLALLTAGAVLLPLGAPILGGESPPQILTTDTAEYCHHLLERLRALLSEQDAAPAGVADLSRQGKSMCERGEIRGGILRLRQAMHMMLSPPDR